MPEPNFLSPLTNPFGLSNVLIFAKPTFIDIDEDGDLDVFVGNSQGNTLFFGNTGNATSPIFTQEAGNFGLSDVGDFAAPTFADIDGDGDLDAFVGNSQGNTRFFRNTGNATSPAFTQEAANFGLSDVGSAAAPTLADIDGDGDLDAFIGNYEGNTLFFRNTGGATSPAFTLEAANFGLSDVGSNATPTFANIDGDGDLDAFVGNGYGETLFFRNTGGATSPAFIQEAANFGLSDVGSNAAPTFADIDGDGDLDAFIGNFYGETRLFENSPIIVESTFLPPLTDPFGLSDVGSFATPTLADIDGDGDLDVFFGNADGQTLFFLNTGSATSPIFTQEAGNFGLSDVGSNAGPVFADIDNDGDLDAFVASLDGILFYRNIGDATSPVFTQEAGDFGLSLSNVGSFAAPTLADIDENGDSDAFVGNGDAQTMLFRNTVDSTSPDPIQEAGNVGQSNVGSVVVPTFADIDNDGDLDAFVGNQDGQTLFYRNTGDATSPIFTQEAGNFGLSDVGSFARPTFGDIDNDGDLDAFIGNGNGDTLFFRNTGDATSPAFTFEGGSFRLSNVGSNAAPTLADIDNDGDLDIFVGNADGNTLFFENTSAIANQLPVANDDSATTNEDTPVNISLLNNDTDVNNDPLSIDSFTQGSNGTVTFDDNGTIEDTTDDFLIYIPNANFNGSDSFTYTISDGNGGTSTATVNITVNPVNDAPVAVNDSATTSYLTPVSISVNTLLANDSDIDSPTLSIIGVLNAVNGTATLNNNGTPTKTSDDYVVFAPSLLVGVVGGTGSFDYILSDGSLTSSATVTVEIGGLLNGTNGSDTLSGTNGNDSINGGNGNDTLYGSGGNDTLDGGNGNDVLYGDGFMNGGTGNDVLYGGNGNDTLYGGSGSDTLNGENGDDLLYGGIGSDRLTGGNGSDKFVLAVGEGTDTVTDYTDNSDKLALSGGLSFTQLTISASGSHTQIKFTSTNEVLAVLTGINPSVINASDFVVV